MSIKKLFKEIMAKTAVHMLENRLERKQSWQKVREIKIGGAERVVINKSDQETQKSRMDRSSRTCVCY